MQAKKRQAGFLCSSLSFSSFSLCVDDVFVQAAKGFLHFRKGQGQVDADAVLAMEGSAILPCHTDIPAGMIS